ncbi:hypothetical protein IWX90DRAFT_86318 [Phyllosticta citrichinensis]|uniref:Secreted protein n=1 Tax=Phyllosticta citrichinensis TaxID=1130410 RepID=A0ABR1XFB3_9PEZI
MRLAWRRGKQPHRATLFLRLLLLLLLVFKQRDIIHLEVVAPSCSSSIRKNAGWQCTHFGQAVVLPRDAASWDGRCRVTQSSLLEPDKGLGLFLAGRIKHVWWDAQRAETLCKRLTAGLCLLSNQSMSQRSVFYILLSHNLLRTTVGHMALAIRIVFRVG